MIRSQQPALLSDPAEIRRQIPVLARDGLHFVAEPDNRRLRAAGIDVR